MSGTKISAGADPVTVVATDKVPMARSASTTAYAATMAELATYANGAYVPNYYTGTPSMDGTGAAGTAAFVARGDHVHPSDTARVAKGGDTMTGLLTLSGAPTATLHAATKGYVDGSAPVGGPYLPLAGGILTGALTPTQTAGLVGTTTNNNANAGSVGEFLTVTVGPAAITTGVASNAATLALTAGDWQVFGSANYATLTSGGNLQIGLNTTSASMSGALGITSMIGPTFTSGTILNTGMGRFSLAAGATVYLVVYATFTGSATCQGILTARRMR